MPINTVAYDFQNIRIDVGGTELTEAVSIDYGSVVETEKQYGSGREAFDATEGVYSTNDCELVLPEFEYRNLIERLGPGYMTKRARFAISVTYAHDGEATYSDTLERCRLANQIWIFLGRTLRHLVESE